MKKVEEKIEKMTTKEKVGLLSGQDFWTTKTVENQEVASVMMTDGPHGVRKQVGFSDNLGLNESIPAICFPANCLTACSWDEELAEYMGEALGEECHELDVDILLGPGVNLKRSPLGGRNFEYYSEDPCLASRIAAGYIKGLQKTGVGTSLKHFAANNQEEKRLVSDSRVEERALRELYLSCFEEAVKEAKPWTVMCSYNRLNGEYTSEKEWLLKTVLKEEWGYEGVVVSDWGAVNDKVKSVKAGLDLEMPGTQGENDRLLLEELQKGNIDIRCIEESDRRILELVEKVTEGRKWDRTFDKEKQHEKAGRIAKESIVLLKNEDDILPLSPNENIAVIGELAEKPRYQGNGSSLVNPYRIDCTLEKMRENQDTLQYAKGYFLESNISDEQLEKEAVQLAKNSDKTVVFMGIPERYETEGKDRENLRLPENQRSLLESIMKVQKNLVVVLSNGGPVEMPFVDEVKGILETYLAGEAGAQAISDILYGKVNPSGKLAETFPLKLEDNPSYLNFPGECDRVNYAEGIFVGYRYYDKKKQNVLFPFGHGLSYTTFEYKNMELKKNDKQVSVSVSVKNTGRMEGSEIVQIYVRKKESKIIRADHELRGFKKLRLKPGEEKTVEILLNERAFSYYNTEEKKWMIEEGVYEILAAASSRDIRIYKEIFLEGTAGKEKKLDRNSTLKEISNNQHCQELLERYMKICKQKGAPIFEGEPDFIKDAYDNTPLRWLMMLSGGVFTNEMMDDVLKAQARE